MKKCLLIVLCALYIAPAIAQDAASLILEARSNLHAAVNRNDIESIKQAQSMLIRATQDKEMAMHAYYYLGLSEYRLVSLGENEQMIDHINKGIDYVEKMLKMDKNNVEGKALMGSLVGWKAGLKPMQAMFLGPRSNRMFADGMKENPENPRLAMFQAVSDYNTPKQFGGDKERAFEGFQEAIALFEKWTPENELEPSWGHADAYAWLGIMHMDREESEQAKAAFEKALEVDSEFGWVKYVLMPQFD